MLCVIRNIADEEAFMKFKDALAVIIKTEDSECIDNALYLYARLFELCTAKEDRKKVSTFYKIDRKLHIVRDIREEGKMAVLFLKQGYPIVKELLPYASFKKYIDEVAEVVLHG